jgi:hypothetical protein
MARHLCEELFDRQPVFHCDDLVPLHADVMGGSGRVLPVGIFENEPIDQTTASDDSAVDALSE